MGAKASFMNNFSLSVQHLTVVLDAKATAPDIQNSADGIPPVFDERRIVEENFLFMPIEAAKELALSLMHVVQAGEKRMGIKIGLPKEKQELWDAALEAVNQVLEDRKNRQEE